MIFMYNITHQLDMRSRAFSLSAIPEGHAISFQSIGHMPILGDPFWNEELDCKLLAMAVIVFVMIVLAVIITPWMFLGSVVMIVIIAIYLYSQLPSEPETPTCPSIPAAGSFIVIDMHDDGCSAGI